MKEYTLPIEAISVDELEGAFFGVQTPIEPRWRVRKYTQEISKMSKDSGYLVAAFKIDQGPRWSLMDDLSHAATGERNAYGSGGWVYTDQAGLERVKLLFMMLRLDDKLSIREDPRYAYEWIPTQVKRGVWNRENRYSITK